MLFCLLLLAVVARGAALSGALANAPTFTTHAADQAVSATITVDAAQVLGTVNPLIFGHNIEAADPKDIYTPTSNPNVGRTGSGVWDPVSQRPATGVVDRARQVAMGMLRYPGGCLVHNYNWKKAVGPLQERPDFTFGVDEYIALCRAIGAEPLMNVSDYVGGPAEAAQLVEYLNAPADASHPWAQKRAQWGHPEPYQVRYFEMGNESDHGNHQVIPFRKFTAEEYAAWFNACAAAMRAVDPAIRMGALTGTATGPADPWNSTVLTAVGPNADFIIVHTYAVGGSDSNITGISSDRLMRACMASGDYFEAMLAEYRALIKASTGRDIPLAITEYNASFVQELPIPYRFSLGPALFSADYLRILLKPETHVLMANYWQLYNGYWGALQGSTWKEMAAYRLFKLWGSHFGTRLVGVGVESPALEFEGCLQTPPARKSSGPVIETPAFTLLDGSSGAGCAWQATGARAMTLNLNNFTGEIYPSIVRSPLTITPGRQYHLSFEARITGAAPSSAMIGLGLSDTRGWTATHSAIGVDGIQLQNSWTPMSGTMATLGDWPGLWMQWRLVCRDAPVTATVEVRNLSIGYQADLPPYAMLTACASLSEDRKRLFLVVFNKDQTSALKTRIRVQKRRLAAGKIWMVTGPSLESSNVSTETVCEVRSGEAVAGVEPGDFTYVFPACSMSVFEFDLGMSSVSDFRCYAARPTAPSAHPWPDGQEKAPRQD